MHYASETHYAFSSVEHIMRDVKSGWLIRYMHANGAFFILVYAHIFRGLYYGSYMEPRQHLWWSGALIYVLMMATAFIGYVLPWGQMSFWGATVITSFFFHYSSNRKRGCYVDMGRLYCGKSYFEQVLQFTFFITFLNNRYGLCSFRFIT